MASSIQLHTVVFVGLHWISLLYRWGDISYRAICLCVVNHPLQIYLSYSKNCWIFHPLCLEGFPRVYLVSYGWFMELIYVSDLSMRFICGWYRYSYVVDIKIHLWMSYGIHKCWNCLIKFLKFKRLQFCSNINMVSVKREWRSLVLCRKLKPT